MTYSKWLKVLVLFILATHLNAQDEILPRDTGMNIVPNPSFEKLRRPMPKVAVENYLAFRNYLDKWTSPTKTTPDLLFNINDGWSDQARTGKNLIGILTHNPISKRSDTWREYIQVKLNQSLEEGEEYLVEYWVKRHCQANMASNNMGAFLSNVPFVNKDYYPLTELELALNKEEIINPGEPVWEKVSGTYVAYGGERFLLIGNFYNNENTAFKDVKNLAEPAWENPYYLLDDVSIRQLIVQEPIVEEAPVFEDIEIKEGAVIRLDRIYFAFDKWDLLPESYEQLNLLVDLLNQYPSMRIAIHGHTDSRGALAYNETLSDNRSKSVYEYLISQFISSERLEYKGFGEVNPVDTNDTDEGRQNNRRVEFVVLELSEENVKVENFAGDGYK